MGNNNNSQDINVDADPDDAVSAWIAAWGLGGPLQLAHAAQNSFDWVRQLLIPGVQAAANILLINKQRSDYDEIADDRRQDIDVAIEQFCICVDSVMDAWDEGAPKTPEAAEYVPVDCCDEYLETVCCNLKNMGKSQEYIDAINRFHNQQAITRQVLIDGKYEEKALLMSCQIADLAAGKVGIDTTFESLDDSVEVANATGSLGGACRSRRQDLGVTKLRLQREAFDRELQFRQSQQQIFPTGSLADIRDMMKRPEQAMQWALLQAQLIQNSLQNKFNLDAVGDPTIAERTLARLTNCNAKLQGNLSKALVRSEFVANYAGLLQPAISGVAQGIGSLANGAFNGQESGVNGQGLFGNTTTNGFTPPSLNSAYAPIPSQIISPAK